MLKLTTLQEFVDGDEDNEPLEIEPRTGIEDGVDLYVAFGSMLDEAGMEIETLSLDQIAKRVAKMGEEVAAYFPNGAAIMRSALRPKRGGRAIFAPRS